MPNYDLSCFSFMSGRIGQLQTLKRFYVIAGDRMEIEFDGLFRLAPLRTFMARDCQVDVFCFFVPERHVYGQTWIDFILDGVDETETFPGSTSIAATVGYLGTPEISGVLPLRLHAGYAKIWNRYFRNVTRSGDLLSETTPLQDGLRRIFGQEVARLPTIWSSSISNTVDSTDREVDTTGNVFDVVDLARIQAQLKTKLQRQWFAQFYSDVLHETFGGDTTHDGDERPTLVYREKGWLSGYDVDGTGSTTLGDYSGKSYGRMRFKMPRRFFGEHGQLWVMAALRFPTVHQLEQHRMDKVVNPSYLEFAGDSDLVAQEPPENINADQYFRGAGANNLGVVPYGQWYRYEPSVVGAQLAGQNIYPFLRNAPTTPEEAFYCQPGEYNHVFKGDTFGNWAAQCALYCDCMRDVQGPLTSVFAGTMR